MVAKDLDLIQLDVKTTFLHGDLEQENYIEQPTGFITAGQEHLIYRLKKSLHGLKQAPRQWYKKFDDSKSGFSKSDKDHCLFTKAAEDGSSIFLILYVDDMLLFGWRVGELTNLVR